MRWPVTGGASARCEKQIKVIEDPIIPFLDGGEVDDFKAKDYRPAIVRNHSPKDISAEQLDRYEQLLRDRQRLEENRPNRLARALCVSERGADPPPTYVLLRGSPYAEGDEVEPGFPSVITAMSPDHPATGEGRRIVRPAARARRVDCQPREPAHGARDRQSAVALPLQSRHRPFDERFRLRRHAADPPGAARLARHRNWSPMAGGSSQCTSCW